MFFSLVARIYTVADGEKTPGCYVVDEFWYVVIIVKSSCPTSAKENSSLNGDTTTPRVAGNNIVSTNVTQQWSCILAPS